MINYASITVEDRNPVKRKLQHIRLQHSVRILSRVSRDFDGTILDFGSGDAQLCRQIARIWPASRIISYEPAEELRQQALQNVKSFPQIKVIGSLKDINHRKFNYIFCLEVLEHLPLAELNQALINLARFSEENTVLVIGVPNEIYISALIKGLFRMSRRYGEVDAVPPNIIKAMLGYPPVSRPVGEISPDIPYVFRHMGFDYRKFIKKLQRYFKVVEFYGSPFPFLSEFFNLELYFICRHK
jgi:SAM-dependent methyltransferase